MAGFDPYRSITQTASLLTSRQHSAQELTEGYLQRIEKLNPVLNSFLAVTPDLALQQARDADQLLERGESQHPLLGMPIAVKDLIDIQGVVTTAGAQVLPRQPARQDAGAVQALRGHGAVFLGKTNLHEIALGLTNVNPHYGACRNPWDTRRVSGGSSGGSAVAVAAGLCAGALGSDTGGSIRVPAALCGVVGLKPTYGRVSVRGVQPLSWHLDHVGPLARSVQDAALLYQALAGYDPLDAYSQVMPLEMAWPLEARASGLRIALAQGEYISDATDLEIVEALARAGRVYEGLGAHIKKVEIPWLREAAQANGIMVTSDAAQLYREQLATSPQLFGEDVRKRLEMGASTTLGDYIRARRTQASIRHSFRSFFDQFDLLLLPATAVTAPLIDGPDALEQARLLTRFTAPFNLAGLPAISVPCGFSSNGLPMGLQLVAAEWCEWRLLQAALAYELGAGLSARRPVL